MRLSNDFRNRMRDEADLRADRDIAETFRGRNAAEVAHLDDEALLAAIRSARATASRFGIADARLRMRFIMLDVFRLPGFWRESVVQTLMNARTGTPDSRFGDVCALLRLGAARTGKSAYVWWS